jgi:hypothetical protein
MLRRWLKSIATKREIRSEMERLRNRLLALKRISPGRDYVWNDGAIREFWRHPTKGWRGRRVEPFALVVGGKPLAGYLSFTDVTNAAKMRMIDHG